MKAPTVMNMSLTVQRNIGWGTVVDVGYVGFAWDGIFRGRRTLNRCRWARSSCPATPTRRAPSTPLPNAFLVPIQGYSAISYDADDATSNYHSLQITANRRFARDLQFGFAYTWSKAMDWTDSAFRRGEQRRAGLAVPGLELRPGGLRSHPDIEAQLDVGSSEVEVGSGAGSRGGE